MVPEVRRIRFSKTGKLKFISHLDLCRTMRIAFIRSHVPIWYSEGFNPHPKMVFALTVSTGSESVCELLDIKVTEEIENSRLAEMLNAVLPPELQVDEVYTPNTKFTELGYASYDIEFFDGTDVDMLRSRLYGELVITRRTKSGDVTADIKPFIKSYSVEQNDGRAILHCTLSAGQNCYLNPEYVVKAVGGTDYDIIRTEIYRDDGETPFL